MNTSTVVIRPATAADLPAIVTMRDALNRIELTGCPHAPIQKVSLADFTAIWSGTLAAPDHCWRVVEAAGQPVGYGLVYLLRPVVEPRGAYLHWAYLEPEHRRQGLGRTLLEHLLAWARARGANRVELQFIEGNGPAAAFWAEMGFTPFARKCVRYLD